MRRLGACAGLCAGAAIASALLLTLLAPVVSPVAAQTADEMKALRQDIEALKNGIASIQKELQEIKTLLRATRSAAAGPPPDVMLVVGNSPSKGSKDARLTLVEFTDYQ